LPPRTLRDDNPTKLRAPATDLCAQAKRCRELQIAFLSPPGPGRIPRDPVYLLLLSLLQAIPVLQDLQGSPQARIPRTTRCLALLNDLVSAGNQLIQWGTSPSFGQVSQPQLISRQRFSSIGFLQAPCLPFNSHVLTHHAAPSLMPGQSALRLNGSEDKQLSFIPSPSHIRATPDQLASDAITRHIFRPAILLAGLPEAETGRRQKWLTFG
jgi:hypothetical protein